jgi:hypothetical protein
MSTRCPASVVALISLGLVGAAAIGLAQPEKQPEKPAAKAPQPDKPAAGHDMDKPDEPGAINLRLQKLAGNWQTATKMEMDGQPPMESKGTSTISGAMGGRSLHENGKGDFMGQPATDFKMWCYNTGSKKFEAVWSWTMSTGYLYMSGESKDEGKTIDWKAWYDGDSGREEFKALTTIASDDQFTVKLYGGKMPDGSPGPTMHITYTRSK